jgi:hypothetical protein
VNLNSFLHLVPSSRMVELYLHFLIFLQGVILNYIIKYRDKFTFYLHMISRIPKQLID